MYKPKPCKRCASIFQPNSPKQGFCLACRQRVCRTCGTAFTADPRRTAPYCSARCYFLGRWGEPVDNRCRECGTAILADRTKRFCSRACYDANKIGKPLIARRRRQSGVCAWCGVTFERPASYFAGKTRVFCSMSCMGEYFSELHRGEYHPNWRGGVHVEYTGSWRPIRESVMRECGGMCERCGKREAIEVHHILPIRYFQNWKDAHVRSNLVAVCRRCHGHEHARLRKSLPLLEASLTVRAFVRTKTAAHQSPQVSSWPDPRR
jgi:5-methylcytosine-specific restriction endonuclease McrA